ncbi:MAG: FAD-dependent monooxygenase, partial [Sciscionella sp.]
MAGHGRLLGATGEPVTVGAGRAGISVVANPWMAVVTSVRKPSTVAASSAFSRDVIAARSVSPIPRRCASAACISLPTCSKTRTAELICTDLPSCRIWTGTKVTGLLHDATGRVSGVRYRDTDGHHDLPATLVIGADGRFSTLRRLSELRNEKLGASSDLLWFRLPRHADDPPEADVDLYFGRHHYIGLLGDAAHVISPVGGNGILMVIQDAVAAANRLIPALRTGDPVDENVSAAIQADREQAIRQVQRQQVRVERRVVAAREAGRTLSPPGLLAWLTAIPAVRARAAKANAYGPARPAPPGH